MSDETRKTIKYMLSQIRGFDMGEYFEKSDSLVDEQVALARIAAEAQYHINMRVQENRNDFLDLEEKVSSLDEDMPKWTDAGLVVSRNECSAPPAETVTYTDHERGVSFVKHGKHGEVIRQ